MEAKQLEGAEEECRVQLASKKQVTERVEKYKEVLRTALDGQTGVPDDTKRLLVEELLANFEAAVQVNVLVNGRPWEEAPDDEVEDEPMDLNDVILETARMRRIYPRLILPHVVHTLKAQRKIVKLSKQAVKPQEVLRDPDQESTMKDLTEVAPVRVKQAFQVIKSINTLQKEAEGLCKVLNMTPSQASLEIHREVIPPPASADARIKQPIKRAAARAAAAEDYKPLANRPEDAIGEDQSE